MRSAAKTTWLQRKSVLIWGTWAVVVCMLLSLVGLYVFSARQQVQDSAWAEADAEAKLVALSVQARTQHVDDILVHTRDSFERYGPGLTEKDALLKSKSSSADVPYLAILIVNTAGDAILSLPSNDFQADFSKIAEEAGTHADDGPFAASVATLLGHFFVRAVPLRFADGTYAGAVVGVLDPAWLKNTLTHLAAPDDLVMTIKQADAVIARNFRTESAALVQGADALMPGHRTQSIPSLDAVLEVQLRRDVLAQKTNQALEFLVTVVLLAISCLTLGAIWLQRAVSQTIESVLKAELANRSALIKSRFLANMSHELRTPMTGVLGAVDLLMDTQPTAEQKNFLDLIRRSGQHLMGILNDVLDISRIDAYAVTLDVRPTLVLDVIEDVVQMLMPRAHLQGVALYAQIELADTTRVDADAFRLTQILTNLIGNAVKFTPQGHVQVKASLKKIDDADILEIRVTDTGIGIEQEQLAHLFQHFYQADTTASRRFGGSGLGLVISKELAELMGGQISVTSRLRQGSCFTLSLPVKNIQSHAAQSMDEAALSPIQQPVFLCFQDDVLRQSMQTHLDWLGITWQDCAEAQWKDVTSELVIFDRSTYQKFCELFQCHSPCVLIDTDLSSHHKEGALHSVGQVHNITVLNEPVRRKDIAALIRTRGRSPDALAHLESKDPVQSSNLAPLQHMKILVAEDNVVTQKILQAFMRSLGCDASFVLNGRAAIDAMCVETFDLVLMDCHMPEVDGYTATQEIRQMEASDPLRRRTPILALTAATTDADVQRCLDAGMDEVCSKPISRQDLEAKLLQWQSRAPTRDEAEATQALFAQDT
ncbi:hypothetical protein B9Z41_13725 [Limnohabitans sp. JirII-31]|nr:hypothetical protein B9Z41_13725 [Limnohabitans sp. JirII-31]